jgi:hypothetical protein
MPQPIRTVFDAVPDDAMALIGAAHERTAESKTDIINWRLTMLGRARPTFGFYWVSNKVGDRPIRVDLTTPASATVTRVTVNLTPRAWTSLAARRQLYRCEDHEVLARAAWLATYFDRSDGNLACGYVANGQRTHAHLLQYLT